ncbi:MAG: hypothetical protein JSW47_10115 [Phycisphaerales bacterium]|nr:MAG: hypothetical protein JSW47_10115 [Phycisphaerales bacterium]
MEERNGIPKFDLAEQIMAEQRKNVSVMRKGPASKIQDPMQSNKVEPISHAIRLQDVPLRPEHVIAEIVARDIERLCSSSA